MAYIKPSVLVYQELQNAGGVANVTPDLGTVIIGPLYHVVRVDPLSPTSLQSTITKTITDMATQQVVTVGDDYIEVPLFNPYPGQIVRTESIVPHITDAKVLTYSFDYVVTKDNANFAAGLRSTFVLVNNAENAYEMTVPEPVADPLLPMPDGIESHIEVGYAIEITYDDPDVTGTAKTTLKGTVTKVVVNELGLMTSVSSSVAVPNFTAATATTATVRFYKVYSYFELQDLDNQFIFSDVNNDILRIETTFVDPITGIKAFAAVTGSNATSTSDYLIVTGKFSVAYKALRQDKYTTVMTISDTSERLGLLGEDTDENPLGLGVQLALDNTTKQVFAVSLKETDDELEWSIAGELLENFKAGYALVPLTQTPSVLSYFKTHCLQMSTPENAAWRVLICNTAIPTTKEIVAKATLANTTGTAKVVGSNKYLSDLTESFISKQVTPGDIVVVTASEESTAVGSWVVDEVINENLIAVTGFSALTDLAEGESITYYIIRNLTRRQRAESVAATSTTFGSNRVWHVQPDRIGVNVQGAVKFLPGYYLCAAVGGVTSGFPIQQGFTNITLAGIEDLDNSNFYFRRDELNLMAEAGTCLYVQDVQQGIPYCRHALTTDMTVLEYREILKVKNWDFLSFYFYDKLKGFIGSWNITPDTLSNMRQVINASIELLKGQKLPRVGAPLLSGVITLLEQDANNKDNINIRIQLEIVSPNNYTNLYLVI